MQLNMHGDKQKTFFFQTDWESGAFAPKMRNYLYSLDLGVLYRYNIVRVKIHSLEYCRCSVGASLSRDLSLPQMIYAQIFNLTSVSS